MRISNLPWVFLAVIASGGCNFLTEGNPTAEAPVGGSWSPTAEIILRQTATPEAVLTALDADGTLPASPSADFSSAPCNRARLAADVSIPEGWQIGPSKAFTKTWRLQNTGSCNWTSDYSLVFDEGDQMSAKPSYPLASGTVAPGGTADISVDMVSPASSGAHQGIFKLRAADGSIFGPGADGTLRVDIVVVPGEPNLITYQVGNETAVAPGSTGDVTAECPVGTIATGGGFDGDKSMTAHYMGLNGNGWRAAAANDSGAEQILTAYAICLADTTGMIVTQVTDDKPIYPNARGQSNVTCPDGSFVSGIGYAYDPTVMVVTGGDRMGIVARIFAMNFSGSSQILRGQPACLTPFVQASYLPIKTDVQIQGGATLSVEAMCPPSTFLTGGSFGLYPWNLKVINQYKKPGTNTWVATVYNPTGAYGWAQSFAICMNFGMM